MKQTALVLALLVASLASAQDRSRDALRSDIEFARSKVYPALVNISVVEKMYSAGRAVYAPAAGSGVIVSPAGNVLTNFHVAGNTTRVTCTLPTGATIPATIVAHDPLSDLSVLKLDLEHRVDPTLPIPFATLGNSDAIDVGDYVLAMGNPLTLSSSMTLGVVSNTKRVFTDFTGTDMEDMDLGEGEKTGLFTRWIQHDALILPGNSGGPLVNLRGEVIGINELGGSGVGFAIPSNIAGFVLNQALTYGEVRRGWLGLTILPVGKLGRDRGALVSSLQPSGPAEKAGLKPGDLVLSIAGDPVEVRFFEQIPLLYQTIAALPAGKEVAIRYLRDGAEATATATVVHMEKVLGDEREFTDVGLTVRAITGPMALARRYPNVEGVLVTGLRPGQPFEEAKPKIEADDVIVALGGEPVKDIDGFAKAVGAIGKNASILVTCRRGVEEIVTVVKTTEAKEFKGGRELPKAWIGIKTQVVTPDLADALGIKGAKGFRITEVYPACKAHEAGLRAGDVITKLNGEKLTASRQQDEEDLRHAIEDLPCGDQVAFAVLRNGAEQQVQVTLEPSPAAVAEAKSSTQKDLDFAVRDLTFLDRIENRWDEGTKGVLVVQAESGGWANMAGLHVKDLVLAVKGQEVTDVASFEKAMSKALETKPKVLEVFLRRGQRTHFVFLEPDWSKIGK